MPGIRRRTAKLFVLLALLLFVQASPALSFGWMCEGRICGIAALFCCCASPDGETRHANCDPVVAPSLNKAVICAAGCGCQQVIIAAHDGPDAAFSPTASIPFPLLAMLPAEAFTPLPIAVPLTTAFRADSRGPPLRLSSLRFISLRAPPVS